RNREDALRPVLHQEPVPAPRRSNPSGDRWNHPARAGGQPGAITRTRPACRDDDAGGSATAADGAGQAGSAVEGIVKASAIEIIVCPSCKEQLSLRAAVRIDREILEGSLACEGCGTTYPIRGGVPRFVPRGEYARISGCQWHWFRPVQLDSLNASAASEGALCATTGWSD